MNFIYPFAFSLSFSIPITTIFSGIHRAWNLSHFWNLPFPCHISNSLPNPVHSISWLLFHSTAPFKNLHPYGPKSRPIYPQANTLIWNLQFSPCQRVSIETVSPKGTFLKILRGSFNSHKDLGEGSMTGNYRAEARTARHTAVIGTLHEKNYLVFCMTFLQVLSDIDKWKAYPQLPKSVLQNIFAVYLKFSKTVTNR